MKIGKKIQICIILGILLMSAVPQTESIFVLPGVSFLVGNVSYTCNSSINFTQVVLSTTYMQFNDIKFYVSSPTYKDINITQITNNTYGTALHELVVNFTVTGLSGSTWFNLSGLKTRENYSLWIDGAYIQDVPTSYLGYMTPFNYNTWSTHRFVILDEGPLPASITNLSSSKSLIELSGFYNIGNYTTILNATLRNVFGWTVSKVYFRIFNSSSGLLYENITSGYTVTPLNATHSSYKLIYNPHTPMNGTMLCDVDIYAEFKLGALVMDITNRTFASMFSIYDIDEPYHGSSLLNNTLHGVNFTWTPGNNTDRTIVVKKNNSASTSPFDGTVVQNQTNTIDWYLYTGYASNPNFVYFTFYGYNATSHSYSSGTVISWGIVGISVFNESDPSQALTNWDIQIKNANGTQVYTASNQNNILYIDVYTIPHGVNVAIKIWRTDYRYRMTYVDLFGNVFYNTSFYLPREELEPGWDPEGAGGSTDCNLVAFLDSATITSFIVDAVVNLSHTLDTMIDVQIYNDSLYTSYGGWILVPSNKYTTALSQVTIDKSILDANTTMVKVNYYYQYCTGKYVPVIYYIRVVETVQTEYSAYDKAVEGAKVIFQRYMNTTGVYESISTLLTDANGYVNLYLIPSALYQVTIQKTGYDTKISDYSPMPPNQFGQVPEKIFRLIPTEPTVTPGNIDYLFKNIVWSIEPTGIRHPGAFTMWFNITSSDSKLEWYSMEIFFWNTTTYSWVSIFYQNDSNAGGGSISFTIPNVTGKYAVKCYFKKTGFPVQELGETGSLIHFIQYFQQWMHGIPDYAYYIVLLFIMVVSMGFFFMYFGTGISTGYIGIIIFAIGLFIHPVTINGISGWIIFAITFIMYTIGIFLWSRI